MEKGESWNVHVVTDNRGKAPGGTILISHKIIRLLFLALSSFAIVAISACGGTTVEKEIVEVEKIVEVPVEKIVISTKEVPVEVEKIVTKEVAVEVEKIVEKIVVATPAPVEDATGPRTGGTLVVAVSSVSSASGLPRDCTSCSILTAAATQDTLLLSQFGADGSATFGPNIATSWKYDATGAYTDMVIREGIPFHQDFGDLSASDVAWSFNQGNAAFTDGAIHDTVGDAAPHLGLVEVLPGNVARFNWTNYVSFAHHKFLSDFHEGIGIFSEAAAVKGDEWLRENPIGTGPFEVVSWETGKGLFTRAVPNHWRKSANVDEVHYFEVPEGSTRLAMMETGEAHIAELDFKDWPDVLADPKFSKGPTGYSQGGSFVFGGNYWERKHPTSDADLPFTLKPELAWVGDPDDAASMESARKVRTAMSMTIDRAGINEAILGGLGAEQYIGSISAGHYLHKDEWKVAFDPVAAKALMTEAGYPDGFDNMAIYIGESGSFTEAGLAFTADWSKHLNIKTELDQRAYGIFRPSRIDRDSHQASSFGACCSIPPTWAEEWLVSASGRPDDGSAGGFNSGMEIPLASETLIAKGLATSLSETEALTVTWHDYLSEQALWPGVFETPFVSIYNTEKVKSWYMGPIANSGLAGTRHLENIAIR